MNECYASVEYRYQYDDIGNRISSHDLGTNRTYTANNLNQYTSISNSASSSEYAEDALSLIYYNYRHYAVNYGNWYARDPSLYGDGAEFQRCLKHCRGF